MQGNTANSSSQQSADFQDFTVFRTVLSYSILIIVIPVITFFGSKFIICDGLFGLANIPSNVYSAVLSIAVLHICLGLYIYKAYSEPVKPLKLD